MMRTALPLCLLLAAATDAMAEPLPTYAADVAPILHRHCVECHREGVGPFPLLSYDDARRKAAMIAKVTQSLRMPPWLARDGDYAFKNARGLTEGERDMLTAWAAADAPPGDLDAAPPAPQFPSEWHNGLPDIVLDMEEEMPVPADGPDIYRNFVVRIPDLPEGTYLRGIDYKSRVSSAHHTLFSLDRSGDMRRAADAEPRPGFASMEANLMSGRIGGWAVGAQPDLFPAGVSMAIPPGTDLMLNAHFHPVGKPEVERARVGLYLTQQPPTKHMMILELPFGFGITSNISIPAGESDYTVRETFTLPVDVLLTGLAPHAHLLARSIRADVLFPDGQRNTLIHVPEWDFAWQEQYHYEQPVPLPAGSVVELTFIYDNSEGNPFNPNTPPRRVTWGPNTTDEMASVTLRTVVDTPAQLAALKEGYGDFVKASLLETDFSIVGRAVRAQERDREAAASAEGGLLSEALAEIRRFRGVMRHDELGLIPFLIGHFVKTELLPWLAPRLAGVLVLMAVFVFAWRRWRRNRREAASQA